MSLNISVVGQNIPAATTVSSHLLEHPLVAAGTSLQLYNPGPRVVHVVATVNVEDEGYVAATDDAAPILPGTLMTVRKSSAHTYLSALSVGGAQNLIAFPA